MHSFIHLSHVCLASTVYWTVVQALQHKREQNGQSPCHQGDDVLGEIDDKQINKPERIAWCQCDADLNKMIE